MYKTRHKNQALRNYHFHFSSMNCITDLYTFKFNILVKDKPVVLVQQNLKSIRLHANDMNIPVGSSSLNEVSNNMHEIASATLTTNGNAPDNSKMFYRHPTGAKPCAFFAQGTCRNGSECRFSHNVGAEINQSSNVNHNPPPPVLINIPPGQPVFSIDVECVATGVQHNARSIAQVALVDEWSRPIFNVYVKQDMPVHSHIYELTGLTKELLDQYGLPLGKHPFVEFLFNLYKMLRFSRSYGSSPCSLVPKCNTGRPEHS